MPAIIQIELPTETLVQLEHVARQQQRTVDEVVREMILHEFPGMPSLPEDIEAELAAFAHLSDDILWLLANNTLDEAQQKELATLNDASQQRELTATERQRQKTLLDAYERMIVRRSQAAGILKMRGHDLSKLPTYQTK